MDTSAPQFVPTPHRGGDEAEPSSTSVHDQSRTEHLTAGLAGSGLRTVMAEIARHAATAAGAAGCVLVLEDVDGSSLTASVGLPPERVEAVIAALRGRSDLGNQAVSVPVTCGGQVRGRLVAVHTDDVPPGWTDVLGPHAQHAASAVELLDSWRAGRSGEARTLALLTLSQNLATAVGATEIAEAVSAVLPTIVGSRAGSIMLWDPSLGVLHTIATSGHEPAERELALAIRLRPDQARELVTLLTRREPAIFQASSASPELAALLVSLGIETVLAVPLLAGDTLMGIATASWGPCAAVRTDGAQTFARMSAVGHQATMALHNAHLLEAVRHQAQHDALTGLPNRAQLVRRLDDVLRGASADQTTALLFCDLDRFKQVNDRLGHAAGDELLRQAAARLRGQLRPDDVVARISSDEFAMLLESDVENEEQAVTVAHRLVEALDDPFRIDGRELRITSSVGVALHTGPDGRGERLLAAADWAMREAKRRGRDQVAVAGEIDAARVVPSLEAELSHAVALGQLRLFFQPVVRLSPTDGQVIVGAEALLRWAHPRLGLLAPGAFLPLAEETGLVTELDLWALGAACDALAGWPDAEGAPLRVAVNLASSTLVDRRLQPTVRAELTRHGLAPERLHLEVVESRALANLPRVVESLVELRQMGVQISLDDFGTGFSTLSWLQALPVDQIKIDRSFIMTLRRDGAPLALVRGVLALARELGIEVIAEGVEEAEQLALLRSIGCDLVQGYLLGRPSPTFDPAQLTTRTRAILLAGDRFAAAEFNAITE